VDHPGYRTLSHASVFPLELMLALGSMVLGGVLERFPNLKVAFLEGNCSWLPWWLYRLDDQWEKFGAGEALQLREKPSTYFLRQCFISIDADEHLAADTLKRLGDDNVVFSTDYPHPDSAFPHAVEELLSLEGISAHSKKKILWDNCARLYGL
jgi:predicted TIM-barrel fold metal-dependent hydrolase